MTQLPKAEKTKKHKKTKGTSSSKMNLHLVAFNFQLKQRQEYKKVEVAKNKSVNPKVIDESFRF